MTFLSEEAGLEVAAGDETSAAAPVRMIAVDLDGTLLGLDGTVSERNRAALEEARQAGVKVAIATGRRHSYAMKVLRGLGLPTEMALISSNGAVVRRLDSTLIERTHMEPDAVALLCDNLKEFRNALVITFDRVGEDGDDARGALVVEELEDLHNSIGRWMEANEPYIQHVQPIEEAVRDDAPIQMMLCGTVERMRRAEAMLVQLPGVAAVGEQRTDGLIQLNRTEYPERNLSILDILPAGCSKGAALLRLAASQGIEAEEILAIGDNWNDASMLEVAARAVLMANAPEDLKQFAAAQGWTIGLRHEQDGVAAAVEAALTGTAGNESKRLW